MAERAVNLNFPSTTETKEVVPAGTAVLQRESRRAYQILRFGFTVAPIIAGFDKFLNLLTDWTQYLAPFIPRMTGISAPGFMKIVGVIEIIAGIGVALKPKYFSYVVAAWLAGIIVNLLIVGQYFDVALRDLGLAIGAFALGGLSQVYDRDT
ncbi:MAG: hypothetical protein ACXVCS_06195 [Bdellovibrionota bacterium]